MPPKSQRLAKLIAKTFSRKYLALVLRGLLIFSLAIPPHLLLTPSTSYATPTGGEGSDSTPYDDFIKSLETAKEGDSLPVVDNFHLGEGEPDDHKQYHVIYEIVDGKEVEKRRIDLGAGVDAYNEAVPVANFDREVRIAYDAEKKEIRFERFLYNKELDREVLTNSHVITNVDLQTKEGAHILVDQNFLFFHTPDGLRVLLKPMFVDVMFKAKFPTITVDPHPGKILEGTEVKEISFFNPEQEPRKITETRGDSRGKVAKTAGAQDILTSVTLPNGEELTLKSSYRDILRSLSAKMPYLLAQLAYADPTNKNMDTVTQTLQDYEQFQSINQMARSLIISPDGNAKSDMSQRAITQLAQEIDMSRLLGLTQKSGGNNGFDSLADKPWDEYELETEWPALHQIISDHRACEDDQCEKKPWQQILIENYNNQSQEQEAAQNEAASIQEKNEKRLFRRILDRTVSLATPRRITALSAAVGGDIYNYYNNNAASEFMLSIVSKVFEVANYFPGLPALTSKLMESAPYFMASDFAITKIMASLLLVLNLRPLAYWMGTAWAKSKGEAWDKFQSFFTAGARVFARINYPIQKLLWGFWGQKNLYYAVMRGGKLNPGNKLKQDLANLASKTPLLKEVNSVQSWVEKQRGKSTAFNPVLPQWVSKIPGVRDIPVVKRWLTDHNDQVQRNRLNINKLADSTALRNQRALLLASLIVSERERRKGQPIDPTTLMMLLQADENSQLQTYLEALSVAPPNTQWSAISEQVYNELAKISENGVGEINEELIEEYYSAVSKVAKRYNRHMDRNPHLRNATTWVGSKWRSFVTFTSKEVIPFLLFSPQGYDLYLRYKTAVINQRNSESASHQFNEDYRASAGVYAFSDAKNFGAMAELDPRAGAEVMSSQLEQIFIYGAKAGVEFDQITMENLELEHPAEPQSIAKFLRAVNKSDGGHGKPQSFIEGTNEVFKEMLSPDSRRSLLGTQMGRMSVQTRGLQVNFLFGAIPRGLALMFATLAIGATFHDVTFEAVKAIPMQLNILFNKLAVFADGAGGFAMGYAVIWALIVYMQNVVKDKAFDNFDEMTRIDSLFDKGIRWESDEHWKEAVEGIQKLYKETGVYLPSEFDIPVDDYSLDLARELSMHSLETPPTSTLPSNGVQKHMNRLGALVSVVLYVSLSNAMWDENAEITPQLLNSLIFFGLTFAVAHEAKPIINAALGNLPVGKAYGSITDGIARSYRKAKTNVVFGCLKLLQIGAGGPPKSGL